MPEQCWPAAQVPLVWWSLHCSCICWRALSLLAWYRQRDLVYGSDCRGDARADLDDDVTAAAFAASQDFEGEHLDEDCVDPWDFSSETDDTTDESDSDSSDRSNSW